MSSDKSAIERTQELLNERGVKHVGDGGMTRWTNESGCVCRAYSRPGHLTVDVAILGTTPEQAIAATLGRGTCHNTDIGTEGYFKCSECGTSCSVDWEESGWGEPKFCPNCGRRIVEVDE